MIIILLFLCCIASVAQAQVFDDFSDGDFTNNPTWSGTDTCFMINSNGQLQLSATTAGIAYLSIPLVTSSEMEWRFWIQEKFSPSMNNYTDVFLCADTNNLAQTSLGYFLRFGAAGSNDAIEFYRQDPQGPTLLCRGNDAAIASSFKVSVKVIRDREGTWSIATDYEASGVYTVEAQTQDVTYEPNGFFGFVMHYTASNSKKFYIDDVYVGPVIIDLEPPRLIDFEIIDISHLRLTFDEALSEFSLQLAYFELFKQDGTSNPLYPDTVSFMNRPSIVLLSFAAPLTTNMSYRLVLHSIEDLHGNSMFPFTYDFSLYQPMENDVVINEIMADPSPPVGLPEWEYIELFNTTSFVIDLKDWVMTIGSSSKVFPSVSIGANEYLLVCKEDAVESLASYGPSCGFSSFSLTNAGTTISLSSPDGSLISEVTFSVNWYHDADKKDGGWSIEQIDPMNPCAGALNWTASTDSSGGTPGRVNAVNAPNALTPSIDRVNMLGTSIILLWFDQQMDVASLSEPSHYQVKELGLYPDEVLCNPIDTRSVELVFSESFEEGVLYTLLVHDVQNCSGTSIELEAAVQFGIPNTIGENDILINEILFDPIAPATDFVELYNPTDKAYDLAELKIGVIKSSFPNPPDTTLKVITEVSRLLLPHTYVVLSIDGYIIYQQYKSEYNNYIDMTSFPSYSNSGGEAILMSRDGVVVDRMTFSEKMHYPLLKKTKGVSLERVSWEVASSQPDNWHSASESVHFATPGYENSMALHKLEEKEGEVVVTPKVFSPDGDGFEDVCQLDYRFEVCGSTMNVYVYTVEGQIVRHLVRGMLIGQEVSIVWDGTDNRGNRVPIGLYIIVSEVFHLDGKSRVYKTAVGVRS